MANRPGAKAPNAQRGKPQGKPQGGGMGASTGGGLTPAVVASAADAKPRRSFGETMASLPRFITEVRAEARKVTWTSWKETWITSVMVFIMVVVTAVFFLVVDSGLRFAIQQLLTLAAG